MSKFILSWITSTYAALVGWFYLSWSKIYDSHMVTVTSGDLRSNIWQSVTQQHQPNTSLFCPLLFFFHLCKSSHFIFSYPTSTPPRSLVPNHCTFPLIYILFESLVNPSLSLLTKIENSLTLILLLKAPNYDYPFSSQIYWLIISLSILI